MGRKCYLFLFFHALASHVTGGWDEIVVREFTESETAPEGWGRWVEALERNLEAANTPSLYHILERAKQGSGGVRVCACSASVQFLGLEPAVVRQRVGDIVGLSTMLDVARDCQILYI